MPAGINANTHQLPRPAGARIEKNETFLVRQIIKSYSSLSRATQSDGTSDGVPSAFLARFGRPWLLILSDRTSLLAAARK
jgi:hypothetical protein